MASGRNRSLPERSAPGLEVGDQREECDRTADQQQGVGVDQEEESGGRHAVARSTFAAGAIAPPPVAAAVHEIVTGFCRPRGVCRPRRLHLERPAAFRITRRRAGRFDDGECRTLAFLRGSRITRRSDHKVSEPSRTGTPRTVSTSDRPSLVDGARDRREDDDDGRPGRRRAPAAAAAFEAGAVCFDRGVWY